MKQDEWMEVTEINLTLIKPSPKQPKMRGKDVAALAASIKVLGVIQPIHVVNKGDGLFEIVAGHRRWAAAKAAELRTIPAIILEVDKTTEQVIRLTENMHRKQLTAFEEAMAIEVLLKMHRSYDEVAADLAMSATTVARRARLLALIPKWRKLIDDVPASSLELIARYNEDRQSVLYDRFEGYLPPTERLKEMLAETDHRLTSAPWKQDDIALLPAAGACQLCEKRSDCQALLFHDDRIRAPKEALCLDPACWAVKLEAYIKQRRHYLTEQHGRKPLEIQTLYTGNTIKGVLRPYQFTRCKKTDKEARAAIIVDGPSAGWTTYVKVKQEGKAPSRGKSKLADMKPAERLKARDARLLGRRAMHIVKVLREILDKKTPAMRKWPKGQRQTMMLDLSIEFGIRPGDKYEAAGQSTWAHCLDRVGYEADKTFDDWWEFMKHSLYRPLALIQRTDEAAKYLESFEYFAAEIMGCDWDTLKQGAVEAIPDRRLKKGEPDPFNPGDRKPKVKARPIRPQPKPKGKARKGKRKK